MRLTKQVCKCVPLGHGGLKLFIFGWASSEFFWEKCLLLIEAKFSPIFKISFPAESLRKIDISQLLGIGRYANAHPVANPIPQHIRLHPPDGLITQPMFEVLLQLDRLLHLRAQGCQAKKVTTKRHNLNFTNVLQRANAPQSSHQNDLQS